MLCLPVRARITAVPAFRVRRSPRALAIAALIVHTVVLAAQPPAPEYETKLGFLVNFIKYVEWPPGAGPLRLCVAGQNPFGPALDGIGRGERIGGREIVPQVILEPDPACAVVFVPRTASRRAYLRAAEGLPVLTVGESPDFLELGGIINFVTEGSEVRFQVDTERARRHKLTISSRLLSRSLADGRDSR